MNIHEFQSQYPNQKMMLDNGKEFLYRYHENKEAKACIVLLTGGIGLSDLFYLHFNEFAKDFTVITFDYQMQFENNQQFADAVAEVLKKLQLKAWLVGQSLGGIVAQIIAKLHPEIVEGMVISNSCSLSKDMNQEAYAHAKKMLDSSKRGCKLINFVPFNSYKKSMKSFIMKNKTAGFSQEEKDKIADLCDAMIQMLTRDYVKHMLHFLVDAENHMGMSKEDFTAWDNKVLLLLSEDDDTFNQPSKDALIDIMSHPTVITNITGGHLALLIRLDEYSKAVRAYIYDRI